MQNLTVLDLTRHLAACYCDAWSDRLRKSHNAQLKMIKLEAEGGLPGPQK